MATIDIANLNRMKKVFRGANVSAKTVSAVGTAMTGLILHNPWGSKTKLVILEAGFVWTTVPAAMHNVGIGLVQAVEAGPTLLTVAGSEALPSDGRNENGASVGRIYDAATFVTAPVAARWFLNALYQAADATLTSVQSGNTSDDTEGSIVLVPGASACLITVTTPAVGMGSFEWAEYPTSGEIKYGIA